VRTGEPMDEDRLVTAGDRVTAGSEAPPSAPPSHAASRDPEADGYEARLSAPSGQQAGSREPRFPLTPPHAAPQEHAACPAPTAAPEISASDCAAVHAGTLVAPPGPVFTARALRFTYPHATRPALDGVDLDVPAGGVYAILGPNGSGKSTLLKVLLGVLAPQAGEAWYAGRRVTEWSRRELARRVGVVPQSEELAFPITVRELVAMGRYPHLGPWRRETAADRRAIEEAMARCDVLELADRPLATLSGGERQLVRIARALAQQPDTLVLDEPTAALDIRHEMEIFERVSSLAAAGRVTVVLVTHNLNLAARYAGRMLLLDRGRVAAEGEPAAVLTREIIERVYRWPVAVGRHPGPGPDEGAPQVVPLAGQRGTEV
jgi:iron complex transport system ATP-binding protein